MTRRERRVDVAIIGGGPVGMLLAAELALQRISVLVVETRTEPDDRPRAGTVHARSLSLLARRGFLPAARARDIVRDAGAMRRAPFQFAGMPVLSITAPAVEPAPIAGIAQARLEAAFERRARALGAEVLRGHTARAVVAEDDLVHVRVETAAGGIGEPITARYVVGADGARGLVAGCGDFPSRAVPATMNAIAGLATSLTPDIPPGWHHTPAGWTLHNPNPGGAARIIALDFSGPAATRDIPDTGEYLQRLGTVLGAPPALADISRLTRFSDYGRFRTRMRSGRLLVIGDAAHVHYPLGGQGLNTGMQDAFTLGWRLHRVLTGRSDDSLLEDWSRERVAVAEAVVANTVLQSRMMNPAMTDLRDAVVAMLGVPVVHDAVAELISGQFQAGFQHDLVVTRDDGSTRTLSELLTAGKSVAIRPDRDTPLPTEEPGCVVATGKVTPEQPWVSALVRPDGYLERTC
ncbi:FAD-dependent monooxygenase [Nocardia miyunensis]|uniref:FAD-dependent monooxygenase n=1 Tax=Nocardia miyunensis TaxID=282684 RepID=UPI00082CA3CD|nr:FAD-dependent monooxygenase [Nocardia miyunensis]